MCASLGVAGQAPGDLDVEHAAAAVGAIPVFVELVGDAAQAHAPAAVSARHP